MSCFWWCRGWVWCAWGEHIVAGAWCIEGRRKWELGNEWLGRGGVGGVDVGAALRD